MEPAQQKLRNEILKVKESDYLYGLADFTNLDLETLDKLIENKFIELKFKFNSSPTVEYFRQFMLKHPIFKCFGHVSRRRDDYSVVITGIEAYDIKDKDALLDFAIQFRLADEFEASEKYCRAWYD